MSDKSKGSGIFGFIKDALVESEPDKPVAAPPAAPPLIAQPVMIPGPRTSAPWLYPGVDPVSGNGFAGSAIFPPVEPDPKALAKLEATLQSTVGPSYSAFKEQYSILSEAIPDESVRFQTALRTSKCSLQDLNQSVTAMKAALVQAHKQFDDGFTQKCAAQDTGNAQQMGQIDAQVAAKTQQIQSISQELQALQAAKSELAGKVAESAARLDVVKRGFEAAYAVVSQRVDAELAHISNPALRG